MPRTKTPRWVQNPPPVTAFKPAGVPARGLPGVVLRLDEYEALRLADYKGLHQEEVAGQLGVSRPTVSRILERARRTVASALVEGKTLFIEGGPVRLAPPGPPWAGRGPWRGRRGRGRHGAGGPPRV